MISNPFARDHFEERLDRTRAAMVCENLDLLILSAPESVYYLSGYQTRGISGHTYLGVPAAGPPVFSTRGSDLGRTSPSRLVRRPISKRRASFSAPTRRCAARSSMGRQTSSAASPKRFDSRTMPQLMQWLRERMPAPRLTQPARLLTRAPLATFSRADLATRPVSAYRPVGCNA